MINTSSELLFIKVTLVTRYEDTFLRKKKKIHMSPISLSWLLPAVKSSWEKRLANRTCWHLRGSYKRTIPPCLPGPSLIIWWPGLTETSVFVYLFYSHAIKRCRAASTKTLPPLRIYSWLLHKTLLLQTLKIPHMCHAWLVQLLRLCTQTEAHQDKWLFSFSKILKCLYIK